MSQIHNIDWKALAAIDSLWDEHEENDRRRNKNHRRQDRRRHYNRDDEFLYDE